MEQKVELLAPAGSMEALIAAVQSGANAVYMSGKNFGARKYAANFTYSEIEEAVKYCRLRDVKVYITVNTLIKDDEFEDAIGHVEKLKTIGVDAVIIQDLGLLGKLRTVFPTLELHASTQMSIHNEADVKFAKAHGLDRVVIARGVGLEEISHISKGADIELEVFVHGALCISYSGQCLMSSMIGNRSGNRGRCAQPCRQMYDLIEYDENTHYESKEGNFLLSPKELNTLERVPDLLEAGITSFKIEGRMKRPEYVSIVVRAYRQAIDNHLKGEDFDVDFHMDKIRRVFNRDFTQGHLFKAKNDKLMSVESATNRGVLVGEVISFSKRAEQMTVKTLDVINKGDELQIRRGNTSVGCRADLIFDQGDRVKTIESGNIVNINMKYPVKKGEKIYKTVDENLMKETVRFYDTEQIRISIECDLYLEKDKPLTLTCSDDRGNVVSASSDALCEVPIKRGISEERIFEQLQKTGGTAFDVAKISIHQSEALAFPMKAVNSVRRSCVEQIKALRSNSRDGLKQQANRIVKREKKSITADGFELRASVFTEDQFVSALEAGIDSIYVKDLDLVDRLKDKYKDAHVIPVLDRVNTSYMNKLYEKHGYDEILVSNLGQMESYVDCKDLHVTSNYSLNVINVNAANFLFNNAVDRVTLSYELTMGEIKNIRKSTNGLLEVIVYGKIPLMIFQYCPVSTVLGTEPNCGLCSQQHYALKDDKHHKYLLMRRSDCSMEMYSSKTLFIDNRIKKLKSYGIDSLRLDFTVESGEVVKDIINLHREILNNHETNLNRPTHTTTGHFVKGIE